MKHDPRAPKPLKVFPISLGCATAVALVGGALLGIAGIAVALIRKGTDAGYFASFLWFFRPSFGVILALQFFFMYMHMIPQSGKVLILIGAVAGGLEAIALLSYFIWIQCLPDYTMHRTLGFLISGIVLGTYFGWFAKFEKGNRQHLRKSDRASPAS